MRGGGDFEQPDRRARPPGHPRRGPSANDLHDRIVGQVERELIQQVLQACERVQIKAAARLGINRNTLHKKLSEYRIDETEPGPSESRRNGDGSAGDLDDDNVAGSRSGDSSSPYDEE